MVWVPDVDHPCPDISKIQNADDIAQALFDNCFDITDGPDAPDIYGVELDRQLVIALTNDELASNNAFLGYKKKETLEQITIPFSTNLKVIRFTNCPIHQ